MIVELLGNFFSQLKCIPTYLYLPTKYILRKSLKNVYQFRNDLQITLTTRRPKIWKRNPSDVLFSEHMFL